MKTNKLVNTSILKSVVPICDIQDSDIVKLANHTYFETLAKDEYIFTNGTNDPWSIYLLSGNVELIYPDGKVDVVSGGTPEAQQPLAHIKPRPASAKAANDIIFIRLKSEDINALSNGGVNGSATDKTSLSDEDVELEIFKDIDRAYKTDKLIVPSLPDIALKVRETAQDPEGDMNVISRLIQADPSLAARIVRVANSPIYRGQSAITNLRVAVSRLGIKVTRDSVMSFSLQQVFETKSPSLKQKMNELWRQSALIAAISAILARMEPKLDADRALLGGLIHNIGALPILAYAEDYPQLSAKPELLDSVINKLSSKIGELILRRWQFDNDIITVVRECRDWMRNPDSKADYCDIVLLAQLYSYIDTPRMSQYPAIDEVPAFAKLPLGRLGPKMTIKVLEEARADIEEIQKMLQN